MGGAYPSTAASRGCILAPPDRGAMGLGSGEYAAAPEKTNETIMRLIWDKYETNHHIAGILLELLGILLELLGILLILPDLLGFYYISNTIGKTIGDIS